MNKMNDPLYYVLKNNRVKYQSNTTSTCGAFALKFLDDMYHGIRSLKRLQDMMIISMVKKISTNK